MALSEISVISCGSVLGVSDSLIEFEDADEHLEREKPNLAMVFLKLPQPHLLVDENLPLTTATLGASHSNCELLLP